MRIFRPQARGCGSARTRCRSSCSDFTGSRSTATSSMGKSLPLYAAIARACMRSGIPTAPTWCGPGPTWNSSGPSRQQLDRREPAIPMERLRVAPGGGGGDVLDGRRYAPSPYGGTSPTYLKSLGADDRTPPSSSWAARELSGKREFDSRVRPHQVPETADLLRTAGRPRLRAPLRPASKTGPGGPVEGRRGSVADKG